MILLLAAKSWVGIAKCFGQNPLFILGIKRASDLKTSGFWLDKSEIWQGCSVYCLLSSEISGDWGHSGPWTCYFIFVFSLKFSSESKNLHQ